MLTSGSADETVEIGERIGRSLEVPAVVLLRGALGMGKTTLARGIARGLGVDDAEVSSPSFTLVNVYRGRCPIYHVDLYRLEPGCDLEGLGLEEFLGRDGVTILEWGERLPFPLEGAVVIELEDAGGDLRRLRVHPDSSSPGGRRGASRTADRARTGTRKRAPARGGAGPDRRLARSRAARPAKGGR